MVLEIGQRDDFANVTGVGRAKGMMIHWDGVHLTGVVGLAKRISQTRVGQMGAGVL